jgi:hypothetical protein
MAEDRCNHCYYLRATPAEIYGFCNLNGGLTANQTTPGTELAHGDDVYRGFAGRVTYKVDRIAVASELQTLNFS